jgi:hypothetical protein
MGRDFSIARTPFPGGFLPQIHTDAPQQVKPVESPHILTEMEKEHGIGKNPGLCT